MVTTAVAVLLAISMARVVVVEAVILVVETPASRDIVDVRTRKEKGCQTFVLDAPMATTPLSSYLAFRDGQLECLLAGL